MNGSQFERDCDRTRRSFNFTFKAASGFIAFVFVCIILGWIILGVLFTKCVKEVNQKGLKAVVTQVWEGPATNVPPAEGMK